MPCIGDGSVGARAFFPILRNWSRTRTLTPPNLFSPTSVAQIAAAVSAVETGGGLLRAVGSNWSYTEVALTRDVTHVIDISALSNILNGDDVTSRQGDEHAGRQQRAAGVGWAPPTFSLYFPTPHGGRCPPYSPKSSWSNVEISPLHQFSG